MGSHEGLGAWNPDKAFFAALAETEVLRTLVSGSSSDNQRANISRVAVSTGRSLILRLLSLTSVSSKRGQIELRCAPEDSSTVLVLKLGAQFELYDWVTRASTKVQICA